MASSAVIRSKATMAICMDAVSQRGRVSRGRVNRPPIPGVASSGSRALSHPPSHTWAHDADGSHRGRPDGVAGRCGGGAGRRSGAHQPAGVLAAGRVDHRPGAADLGRVRQFRDLVARLQADQARQAGSSRPASTRPLASRLGCRTSPVDCGRRSPALGLGASGASAWPRTSCGSSASPRASTTGSRRPSPPAPCPTSPSSCPRAACSTWTSSSRSTTTCATSTATPTSSALASAPPS